MEEAVWQFRKYYGPRWTDDDGWSEWEDVTEGREYYGPRTHLEEDINNTGMIEFRVKPPEPKDCTVPTCDAVEDFDGLCAYHNDLEDALNDPWPDFYDEYGREDYYLD